MSPTVPCSSLDSKHLVAQEAKRSFDSRSIPSLSLSHLCLFSVSARHILMPYNERMFTTCLCFFFPLFTWKCEARWRSFVFCYFFSYDYSILDIDIEKIMRNEKGMAWLCIVFSHLPSPLIDFLHIYPLPRSLHECFWPWCSDSKCCDGWRESY